VPVLRILVLAFVLAHAAGVTDALEAACDECGERDCDDGACPPLCPACHATHCPAGIVTAVAVAPANPARPTQGRFAEVARAAANPDPREILRVPIALLS